MRSNLTGLILCALVAAFGASSSFGAAFAEPRIYEAFPERVKRSLKIKNMRMSKFANDNSAVVPFHLIESSLKRWTPGSTIRVAFNGGDESVYKAIEDVANEWLSAGRGNLHFQFKDKGEYLTWSTQDTVYAAEVRVAFVTGADGGFWSHMGRDSVDNSIVGGNPYEASMNLGGFDYELPDHWKGTVLHEFGHALGFHHEHQNPKKGCDVKFDNDPGYEDTTDSNGVYVSDLYGRQPGVYTYFSGSPNYWDSRKVDDNWRPLAATSDLIVGTFDKNSVMKYYVEPFLLIWGEQSECFTEADAQKLSAEDIAGIVEAYPFNDSAVRTLIDERRWTLSEILRTGTLADELKPGVAKSLEALQ